LSDWTDIAISTLLRVGVVLSVLVIAAGLVIAFAHHPGDFSSRPAPGAHFPNSIGNVVEGVRGGDGEAIVAAGLLLLIATPVARVALSIVIFVIERDRLYIAITAAVFVILMISFAVGRSAA
jgi:uncharacterized membrane protein